jgi:hypothetical protein
MQESIPKVNSLKFEHLNKDAKPIMVCISARKDFLEGDEEFLEGTPPHKFNLKNPENVKWSSYPGYIISNVSDGDKFSEGFSRCTGLVVKGTDKETGENISFLTHQAPFAFIAFKKDKSHQLSSSFKAEFDKALYQIKEKCIRGTIDAVIVGGDYFDDDFSKEASVESIKLLSTETNSILGFEPVVINGPKKYSYGEDDVYFDNKNGRLYFVRPKVNEDTKDFTYSDTKNEKQK